MSDKQISITNSFISDIKNIIDSSKSKAVRSVEFYRVEMYWKLGERIFNEEQGGKHRADYGSSLIKNLAKELEPMFGSGFSSRQLARSRQFYREYPIMSALRSQFNWFQYRNIGQLQMYVNYYDRYEKNEDENPTIGILLAPNKNHTVVELSLPKQNNLYASEYQLYLPKKEVLENKVEKWVEEYEESKKVSKDEVDRARV